ncbi:MAG: hypothetical protein N2C14_16270, partial [Planctomycetales bacterium]
TGHKDPRIHLKMIAKPFRWDTAQMPINILDAFYRSFQKEVVPECAKKGIGVIGLKGLGGGFPAGRIPDQFGISGEDCRRFCLSLPISSLVVGITSKKDLAQDVGAAREFKPMSQDEIKKLFDKVRKEASDGRHELFKSTQFFDGPYHRVQHGFDVEKEEA